MIFWVKLVLIAFLLTITRQNSYAVSDPTSDLTAERNWKILQKNMQEEEDQKQILGNSYLISGTLIFIGSYVGHQMSTDTVSKVVYGISQGLGVFIGVQGAELSLVESESSNYFKALNQSSLSASEKIALWSQMQSLKTERDELLKKINMASYFVLSATNIYAASTEKDNTAKSVFQLLAIANLCFGLSYTF